MRREQERCLTYPPPSCLQLVGELRVAPIWPPAANTSHFRLYSRPYQEIITRGLDGV